MEQVLLDLYEGKLCPRIKSLVNCEDLRQAQHRMTEKMNQISQYLPKNQVLPLVDGFTEEMDEYYRLCRETEFIEGFCLGARLIMEVLEPGRCFDYAG